MNNTFDKREEGFEVKFAREEKLKFKATVRRNKNIGLWAARLMGLEGEAAENYASSIIKEDFLEPGDEDVFRKLRRDFDEAGVAQSDHQIRRTMREMLAAAMEEVQNEE
ncbi:MAG TPA: DUF1476 domain-containing protein [Rhizobiales bacterium]|nr:DUF1476 domain-containing protein [Hyphomicrobiales bacterium]